MKINWKLRFSNKVTLTSIVVAAIALIYQILGMAGVVPGVAESQIVQLAGMIINLLAMMGIITDPTTEGVSDSSQALDYEQPKSAQSSAQKQ